MIIRARAVVPMDGPPLENGAIVVAGNTIAEVGRWDDLRGRAAGEVLDLGECALLPGLINAHCHLDYTCLRGSIPRQESFTAWIREINARKTSLTAQDYVSSIASGAAEAASFGTTSMVNLAAFPELLMQLPPLALRTWWCAETIDVRAPVSPASIHEQLRVAFRDGDLLLGGLGLAPHAPFTASAELYREARDVARQRALLLTTHLAESREETEMFRDGRGALFDFMRAIGRTTEDCGSTTPLELMLRRDLLDERWLIAHLNELSDADLVSLERAPKFDVVHCPRSHAYFGHSRFQLSQLRALGFNICLGTDSLASNDDLSLFAEMRQLWRVEPTLSARELLLFATVNAAAALGRHEALGKIRAGFLADMIAVPWHGRVSEIFGELVSYPEKIPWRMINGRVDARQ